MYFFKYLSFVKNDIPINNQKANTLRRNFTAQMFYKQMHETNIIWIKSSKTCFVQNNKNGLLKNIKTLPVVGRSRNPSNGGSFTLNS